MTDTAADETNGERALASRVRHIAVRGLFGLYDHDIPLGDDPRVTIIHGPNGVRKTTVLRLVESVLERPRELRRVPFLRVEVRSDGGSPVGAARSRPIQGDYELLGPDAGPAGSAGPRTMLIELGRLDFLLSARGSLPRVVRPAAGLLGGWVLADYRSVAQTVDELVVRLAATAAERAGRLPAADFAVPRLTALLEAVRAERAHLSALGVAVSADAPLPDLGDVVPLEAGERAALAVTLLDLGAVHEAWRPFAQRLEVLLRQVGRKLLHKSLRFDPSHGLTVTSDTGEAFPLKALSSGEQHELLLRYILLFEVLPNTLVLIDEPELSLHVLWQKRFIDELIEITRLVGFDALVATHSPFIIGAHDDLLVDLDPRLATPGTAR